jgi:hypothetical protein
MVATARENCFARRCRLLIHGGFYFAYRERVNVGAAMWAGRRDGDVNHCPFVGEPEVR